MGLVVGYAVHECPEVGAVVMVYGVAQFVLYDIVDEVGREGHEVEGEVDGVLA